MAETYQKAADQSARAAGDITFHAHRSPEGLVLFDVCKTGGVPLRLEFPPGEAVNLAHTILAIAGHAPVMVPAERSDGDSLLAQLSQRERDVVEALARGMRLSAIAKALFISHHTARNHLKHAFRKTGTHSQVELLAAIRNGGRDGSG